MNKFSSIFGQMLQIFSKGEFYSTVAKTGAEKRAKGFTCWQQFVGIVRTGAFISENAWSAGRDEIAKLILSCPKEKNWWQLR